MPGRPRPDGGSAASSASASPTRTPAAGHAGSCTGSPEALLLTLLVAALVPPRARLEPCSPCSSVPAQSRVRCDPAHRAQGPLQVHQSESKFRPQSAYRQSLVLHVRPSVAAAGDCAHCYLEIAGKVSSLSLCSSRAEEEQNSRDLINQQRTSWCRKH